MIFTIAITFVLCLCRSYAYIDVHVQDRNLVECGGSYMSTETSCQSDSTETDQRKAIADQQKLMNKFVRAQVAIMRRKNEIEGFEYRCSGVLVTRRHVLTAAWCFRQSQSQYAKSYQARIGSTDFKKAKSYAVESIKVHEKYQFNNHQDNIAVMTLAVAVDDPKVSVVCLPDEKLAAMNLTDLPLHMAGWGRLQKTDFLDNFNFYITRLRITSNKECNQVYESNFYSDNKSEMLRACLIEGEKDACVGARGSSLMLLQGDKWHVMGIRSLMQDCLGQKHLPIVYARVSVYADWIRESIQTSHLLSQLKL